MSSDYGKPEYWNERYAASEGESFDWYRSYNEIKQHLDPFLSTSSDFEILIPGCGSSSIGADLYDQGYLNITNIDLSSVVIHQMNDKYADREEMEYTVMDARNLEYLPDGCFNLVIDKGMLDSQLCGEENIHNVSAVTREMFRVLKPGGVYCCISYGVPPTRMGYLSPKGMNWAVEFKKIAKPQVEGASEGEHYYMYICRKLGEL